MMYFYNSKYRIILFCLIYNSLPIVQKWNSNLIFCIVNVFQKKIRQDWKKEIVFKNWAQNCLKKCFLSLAKNYNVEDREKNFYNFTFNIGLRCILFFFFFCSAKMYKNFSTNLTNDNGINRISYKNSLANVVLVKQQGEIPFSIRIIGKRARSHDRSGIL